MNKLFIYLLVIGGLILFVLGGWEVLQITTGGKVETSQTVIDLPQTTLFPENVEQHLISDPEFRANSDS